SIDDLAKLSVGTRDRLLLAVRIGTFGSRLDCETSCPACGTRLELSLDARDLVVPERDVADYAARLTTEVHQLARAYGWSEESILAMGPVRRRRYLSLVLQ